VSSKFFSKKEIEGNVIANALLIAIIKMFMRNLNEKNDTAAKNDFRVLETS
jgi:hypothetical protein